MTMLCCVFNCESPNFYRQFEIRNTN